MRTLYLDCFAGISGDMFLGAMLDLGISPEDLTGRLSALGLDNFELTAAKTLKNGIGGTKTTVRLLREEQQHRHLSDILKIIDNCPLPAPVKEKSTAVFRNLAAAEAKTHNISVDRVYFHEVGATDAIVDIVGAILALDMLGIEQVFCSPLPLGAGFVECAHGILPLPAPAVLELLKGIPAKACDIEGETVTPTGAALALTLAADFGPMPSMEVRSIGYGAGQADRRIPNLMRVVLGDTIPQTERAQQPGVNYPSGLEEDFLTVIEANIDDINPEFYEYIIPQVLSAGAVDVWLTPVIMKKGRPAQVISCLADDNKLAGVIETLLAETTTLGVRTYPCRRFKLAGETVTVETEYGPVTVKVGRHPSTRAIMNIAPEWNDCKDTALKTGVPAKIVYDAAKAGAWMKVK